MQLEVACFHIESGLIAANGGADRIEFCAAMELGGITPSLQDFEQLRSQVAIPIYVMLRPRGGHFQYSKDEIAQMSAALQQFKAAGANGFVFGALNAQRKVDKNACEKLLALAGEMPCTFHRAIDSTVAIPQSVSELIALGFSSVLTTGGAASALKGIKMIELLQKQYGAQICIMPGGGVRTDNVAAICQNLHPKWIHSSCVKEGSIADYQEVRRIASYSISS